MTYDFKKGPEDFSWVTTELFDEELRNILANEYPLDLLSIPGIYEILSEHYNNEVLTNLQRHREDEEYDLCEEDYKDEDRPILHAGGLCPVCGCNPLRGCGDVLVCTGDVCGFQTEADDNMAEGDECPNCHCGTLEETDDEFRCRGECGSIFRKEKR